MKRRTCRTCKAPLRGYGNVCDRCCFRHVDADRKGQSNMFQAASKQAEVEDDMAYMRKLFNLPEEDAPVPEEVLKAWIEQRCLSRKTYDDWAGVRALHRDFIVHAAVTYTVAAFMVAVGRAGFAVHRGMVSRLVLKDDFKMVGLK